MTGTAVYVFCILADGIPDAITPSELVFIMDDTLSGTFDWSPDNSIDKYTYNVPVYANTDIATTAAAGLPGLHNLTVLSTEAVLFDYAVYTYVTLYATDKV